MKRLVDDGPGPGEVTDELILAIRAFVKRKPRRAKKSGKSSAVRRPHHTDRPPPSAWALIFDCETTTTPDQRLRFGAYQLRHKGMLWESGLFYDPDAISKPELDVLLRVRDAGAQRSDNGRVFLRTRAEFVDAVFYDQGFRVGAQIVGFNLPFDISRLAISHTAALRQMKGGFSFTLSRKKKYPPVAVRHRSQKSSFIHFVGTAGYDPENDEWEPEATVADRRKHVDRGYFVDVKTLAASLMSGSYSLASLTKELKTPTIKLDSDDHGAELTAEYIEYALDDVQATYECFEALSERFTKLGLTKTGAYELYSEASLGKAYLKAMNIAPLLDVQPNFPPAIIGQILSAYYGGRSEVHIRRDITEVMVCDFLSMYPTVCTLMNLWNFVRAQKIDYTDDSKGVRHFVDKCTLGDLQNQSTWQQLHALVQVLPDRDLFPVRAVYSKGSAATIGLNYLTSDEPLWFSLADVLVSKILTGKTPRILKALRFSAGPTQKQLKPVTVAGKTINPVENDFYRELIIHRQNIKSQADQATDDAEKKRLETDQLATKILANATSYGIFVELNVEGFSASQDMLAFGNDAEFSFRGKKSEKPGRYFNPLLGVLITGAARLMLALAERNVNDQGLDWVFCDTDSMAIANKGNYPVVEFRARVTAVTDWFKQLNPYDDIKSIFQIEKYNYKTGSPKSDPAFEQLYCLAISAKRYALFNRDPSSSAPIIRKASGHGLGHLMPPYDEEPNARRVRISEKNVPLWQQDLWIEIIKAADGPTPHRLPLRDLPGYDVPACSRYAATSPSLLGWFEAWNKGRPYAEQVKPFNFLMSLQLKSDPELAETDMDFLIEKSNSKDAPKIAAPYDRAPRVAAENAFDRKTGKSIAPEFLKTHGRSLASYHLHPESKFQGAHFDGCGVLQRRHVFAVAFTSIGKEADRIEPREVIGDEEGPVEFGLNNKHKQKLRDFIAMDRPGISDALLAKRARVSPHTLREVWSGNIVSRAILERIFNAIRELKQTQREGNSDHTRAVEILIELIKNVGRNKLAAKLEVNASFLTRVVQGRKKLSNEMTSKIVQMRSWLDAPIEE